MSADTAFRPETAPARERFVQLLHAEWTKFRTVRGWVIGLITAALITVLVGLLGPAGSSFACVGRNGEPCTEHVPPLGPGGEPVTDSLYLVHQPLVGDGSLTVRVTSLTASYPDDQAPEGDALQPWSKAGIILKNGTGQGSAYAAVMVTGGNGVRMQSDYTHDIAGRPGTVSSAAPRWLRLTRSGATITGEESADGARWSTVGTTDLAGLPSTVEAGLFVASPGYNVTTSKSFGGSSSEGGPTLATALFDHAGLQGLAPRGTWTGDALGDQPRQAGFHPVGDGLAVSGSGDVAPLVIGQGSLSKTIENGLVGAFAGLIAVIVVATTFFTAEYRRGMIRTTLAASPRRGRVLAAKTVVIGSVTFVTGLVAAAVSVAVVAKLERDKGLYLFPVPTLTEVRVVAGTAALLAVAAVLALAVGTAMRRSAGAVTTVIVALVLPYVLAVSTHLPASASQWLLRFSPAAAFSIMQSLPQYPQVAAGYTPADGYFPLSPWGGFAVLCGYTALALGLAFHLLRRRDA